MGIVMPKRLAPEFAEQLHRDDDAARGRAEDGMKRSIIFALIWLPSVAVSPAWSEENQQKYIEQEQKCQAIVDRASERQQKKCEGILQRGTRQQIKKCEAMWNWDLRNYDRCQLEVEKYASPQEREERKQWRGQQRAKAEWHYQDYLEQKRQERAKKRKAK